MMIKIAVVGGIGSGKSYVGDLLAKKLNYTFIPEPFEQNHWLGKMLGKEIGINDCCQFCLSQQKDLNKEDFEKFNIIEYNYCRKCGSPLTHQACKLRYSGIVQLYFLYSRLKQYIQYSKQEGIYIVERTVYDDKMVFAQKLFDSGEMTKEDFELYLQHYEIINSALELGGIAKPEYMIFLTAPFELQVERIEKRLEGRLEETGLDESWYITEEGKKYLQELNEYYYRMFQMWEGDKLLVENIDAQECVNNVERWIKCH